MTPVKKPASLTEAEWVQWRTDAVDAVTKLKEKYQPGSKLEVDDVLYKRAMKFLMRLFNDKCAYCESLISNTHPGDVEHYRPKGRIKGIDGKIVKIKLNGQEVEHPGYWWLCYEWSNLLPSCIDCNRRRNQSDTEAAGKADIFPIDGPRAGAPNDALAAEKALLLNPSDEDFDATVHFEFQHDGKIATKSKRAETSCELFGLNLREPLVKQRVQVYSNARNAVIAFLNVSMASTAMGIAVNPAEKPFRDAINDMWEGRTPHTAFARLALLTSQQQLAEKSIKIPLPLP